MHFISCFFLIQTNLFYRHIYRFDSLCCRQWWCWLNCIYMYIYALYSIFIPNSYFMLFYVIPSTSSICFIVRVTLIEDHHRFQHRYVVTATQRRGYLWLAVDWAAFCTHTRLLGRVIFCLSCEGYRCSSNGKAVNSVGGKKNPIYQNNKRIKTIQAASVLTHWHHFKPLCFPINFESVLCKTQTNNNKWANIILFFFHPLHSLPPITLSLSFFLSLALFFSLSLSLSSFFLSFSFCLSLTLFRIMVLILSLSLSVSLTVSLSLSLSLSLSVSPPP